MMRKYRPGSLNRDFKELSNILVGGVLSPYLFHMASMCSVADFLRWINCPRIERRKFETFCVLVSLKEK